MNTESAPLLLIAGPTAVGKTELAITCAQKLGGEIINIDSVQLYRGLDIGSAKPSVAERSIVPHHLFDVFDPGEQGTVGQYLELVSGTLAAVRSKSALPIFVGGTGLYVTGLLQGLAQLPKADPQLRSELNALSIDELRTMLATVDIETAQRLPANDRVRIIRAIETARLSGQAASALRAAHGHRTASHHALVIVPLLPREELYARIDARVHKMFEAGLLQEFNALAEKCGADAPAFDAIGYREIRECQEGKFPIEELASRIALNTRRFAKRQLTFWRNEPAKRGWGIRPGPADLSVMMGGVSQSRNAPVKPMPALQLTRSQLIQEIAARLRQPFEKSEVWFVPGGPALAS